MPELPEVETVRAGVAPHVVGRRIATVEVLHPRAVRRHRAGSTHFATAPLGLTVTSVHRRGKYLWLVLQAAATGGGGGAGAGVDADSDADADAVPGDVCVIAHLGMSGQLLLDPVDRAPQKHLRVRFTFDGAGPELRFVDQRTFGGLILDDLVATVDGVDTVPALVAHIARDPLDRAFDDVDWIRRVQRSRSQVKRVLLDQTVVSGIGNIYADESLWRARINGTRLASTLSRPKLRELLGAVRAVMSEALTAGGTSFDSLYVNVNGQSGYFDRSLAVYGQHGRPCPRCGTAIRRTPFMNRSSFWCPRCQAVPRAPRGAGSPSSLP